MSQKKSKLQLPPSRPMPLSRLPPNGAARSRIKKQLTHTVPAVTREAMAVARSSLRLNRVAGKAIARIVGHLDHFIVGTEALPGQHRAKHFALRNLQFRRHIVEQSRFEIQFAEIGLRAAPYRHGARLFGAFHESGNPVEMLFGDQRPDPCVLVARIAQRHMGHGVAHPAKKVLFDASFSTMTRVPARQT